MRLADDKVLLATDEPVIEVIATVFGISPSSARPGRCRRYSRRVAVRRPDRTRADRVAAATYPTPHSSRRILAAKGEVYRPANLRNPYRCVAGELAQPGGFGGGAARDGRALPEGRIRCGQ